MWPVWLAASFELDVRRRCPHGNVIIKFLRLRRRLRCRTTTDASLKGKEKLKGNN